MTRAYATIASVALMLIMPLPATAQMQGVLWQKIEGGVEAGRAAEWSASMPHDLIDGIHWQSRSPIASATLFFALRDKAILNASVQGVLLPRDADSPRISFEAKFKPATRTSTGSVEAHWRMSIKDEQGIEVTNETVTHGPNYGVTIRLVDVRPADGGPAALHIRTGTNILDEPCPPECHYLQLYGNNTTVQLQGTAVRQSSNGSTGVETESSGQVASEEGLKNPGPGVFGRMMAVLSFRFLLIVLGCAAVGVGVYMLVSGARGGFRQRRGAPSGAGAATNFGRTGQQATKGTTQSVAHDQRRASSGFWGKMRTVDVATPATKAGPSSPTTSPKQISQPAQSTAQGQKGQVPSSGAGTSDQSPADHRRQPPASTAERKGVATNPASRRVAYHSTPQTPAQRPSPSSRAPAREARDAYAQLDFIQDTVRAISNELTTLRGGQQNVQKTAGDLTTGLGDLREGLAAIQGVLGQLQSTMLDLNVAVEDRLPNVGEMRQLPTMAQFESAQQAAEKMKWLLRVVEELEYIAELDEKSGNAVRAKYLRGVLAAWEKWLTRLDQTWRRYQTKGFSISTIKTDITALENFFWGAPGPPELPSPGEVAAEFENSPMHLRRVQEALTNLPIAVEKYQKHCREELGHQASVRRVDVAAGTPFSQIPDYAIVNGQEPPEEEAQALRVARTERPGFVHKEGVLRKAEVITYSEWSGRRSRTSRATGRERDAAGDARHAPGERPAAARGSVAEAPVEQSEQQMGAPGREGGPTGDTASRDLQQPAEAQPDETPSAQSMQPRRGLPGDNKQTGR